MTTKQEDETHLEELLRLAAKEPAHRPEFYQVLLESDVYVLGTAGSGPEGPVTLAEGSTIELQNWESADGTPVLPFFSSLKTLQQAIEVEASYLQLPARALFEMTPGATLFLNPKAPYGKEFLPSEVQSLLADGLSRAPQQRIAEKETRVLLGQPAEYPAQMIDSLTQLFAKHPNVKRGYVALMHDASLDEKPHLIVGIEASDDVERVIAEAGEVAADTAPEGEPVDLLRVQTGDSGVSRYLLEETKPFYERRWGARLRALLGSGRA